MRTCNSLHLRRNYPKLEMKIGLALGLRVFQRVTYNLGARAMISLIVFSGRRRAVETYWWVGLGPCWPSRSMCSCHVLFKNPTRASLKHGHPFCRTTLSETLQAKPIRSPSVLELSRYCNGISDSLKSAWWLQHCGYSTQAGAIERGLPGPIRREREGHFWKGCLCFEGIRIYLGCLTHPGIFRINWRASSNKIPEASSIGWWAESWSQAEFCCASFFKWPVTAS